MPSLSSPALAIGYALLLWWLGTGLVLLLIGLPRSSYRTSLAAASLLAVVALIAIAYSTRELTVGSAYLGFTAAVLLWCWQELAFLSGKLTGPRRHACAPGCRGLGHMRHAIEAILWHELAIIGGGLLVAAITWHGDNAVALWTYGVLWVMRASAKLNLHFGVRNTGEELLPPHLAYLGGFFRRRPFNALLPVSVIAGGAVAGWLFAHAFDPATGDALAIALVLTAALLALAVLEHLMLVLPLDVNAMWRWALRLSRRVSHHMRRPPHSSHAVIAVAPAAADGARPHADRLVMKTPP